MKAVRSSASIAAMLLTTSCVVAHAASLRVSPILVDAGAARNVSMTLTNNEARPISAQVRVFRWSQSDGADQLTPADDVVASPPIVTIAPREDYIVRIQRVENEPVAERSYRIVIDELPNPNRQRNGTVAVVLRYIVPAFFFAPDATQARVSWSLGERNGKPVVIAKNSGDKRMQLNNLAIKTGDRTVMIARGLSGYVLGHSEREWPLSAKVGRIQGGTIIASSDHGAVRAPLGR